MRPTQDSQKAAEIDTRTLTLRIVAVCATVLIVIMVVGLIINLVNLGRLNAEKTELAARIAAYEKKIEQNETVIGDKTTDAYLEQAAREELGMVNDGELVYVD